MLINFYQTIKQFILDIIFPIECLGCGKSDVWLCQDCLLKIPINNQLACPICHKNNKTGAVCPNCQDQTKLDGLLVTTAYENEIIQEAIHILKYKYIEEIAISLGQILASFIGVLDKNRHLAILKSPENVCLIPVPLHKKRLLERGFNQSEVIAEEFNKGFHFNLQINALKRQRHTMPQVKLKGKERKENIKGAFAVNHWKFPAENVIILDDVATTLATLDECAKVLKQAGAYKVWGLVVARGG